ncbi:MAG: DUF3967 domain-containing protein [Ectobacillus sp.]
MGEKFKTKDVANKTGIPGNMVRKYSQTLEQLGYPIDRVADARCFKMEDMRLLKTIHARVSELQEDITDAVAAILKETEKSPAIQAPAALKPAASAGDVNITIQEQNKKFEEFMIKLDTLAQLNEAIIHQNSTLISQNRQKDKKLDELMHQVYIKEGKQEKLLQNLSVHVHKSEAEQREKLDNLLSHISKKEERHNEKISKLMNQVYKKEASRDEQLMQLIREMQETKRMIAASQESSIFKSIRNMFGRLKPEKPETRS